MTIAMQHPPSAVKSFRRAMAQMAARSTICSTMRSMTRSVALCCAAACATTAFAAPSGVAPVQRQSAAQANTPPRGGYGFDWLQPLTARCVKIPDSLHKRFQGCRYGPAAGFGLDLSGYSCPLSDASEYVVYASRQDCRKALDAMRSNAP